MPKNKITFFEITNNEKNYIKKKFDNNFQLEFYKEPLTEDNANLIKDANVVSTFIYSKLNAKVILQAKKLKLITTRSTGYNHIDLKAAQKQNISVAYVPYYGENTVAEHTFALILSLSRNIHKAYVRTVQGNFSLEGLRGFDLKGKTIGVIGAGSIGVHVMKIAKGFGMNILAFDAFRNHILEELVDFKYTSLEELLSNSNIITFHCPYNESTRYLINMNNINLIKKGTIFINTARAGLIEPSALYYAIDKGIFSGVGLDVFEGEELVIEEDKLLTKNVTQEQLDAFMRRNLLLRKENVIITPHMAFDSNEAIERILETTIQNIKGFLNNEKYYKVI